MASLRERNRSRTIRDIEAAALTLFEEQGYSSTTVEQIARRAGVSQATFFRHFGSKEEVLFVNEQDAVDGLVALVAARSDQSQTLAALAQPVAEFGHNYLHDPDAETQRVTRLVMTTRDLEARSMRMRLRWERALAKQFATERGADVAGGDVLLANLAVGCLAAALWQWQAHPEPVDIAEATTQMFSAAT
ncbi:TetR family transcriptional regulator [Mycobacterium sp. CBMA293]|uniref:TetR/AcrR family transcriptional regulator n=1 Tax=unclassified Mycolicibacterium TaxID=2636767 RepID=UPI0012DE8A3B|nr:MULTISPECIES: TetR/AcrR family transcriptional regulator [unclassified Mycolicibacterium]MUL49446.1 TetR family transcriptional regulator [Mycolicibacterium sp. CBMA 360]MUL57225.1 TetR family transcriptional regulator [Mycolicibacterium sp. CBMA 335]MUL70265.1 TetR family transcriptional regulator [Mycolicibacterium sp. CBMA 311]MUL92313.1 TetR family transcriptional regulator [Mycolicibacterium sp. CBMA 230]MUM06734.1 TetR family transcriptional regulator [Mycolicibacterium sp. CBMA 213]